MGSNQKNEISYTSGQKELPYRVAGLSLRDRVRSSDICRELTKLCYAVEFCLIAQNLILHFIGDEKLSNARLHFGELCL